MQKFIHHKHFRNERQARNFLFPHVCFHCRKSFKKPKTEKQQICPQCRGVLFVLSRKFSAPKRSNIEQWQKVQYLVEHGFLFQSVYEKREDNFHYRVSYPQTLGEAKVFVIKYKEQALNKSDRNI